MITIYALANKYILPYLISFFPLFPASCVGITSCFGFLGSSFFMELCGRKWTHVLLLIPGSIGWLLISFATNYSMLLAGRLLGGIIIGGATAVGAVTIGEYTSPINRGLFLSMKTSVVCLGALAIHVLAHYVYWRTAAIISLVPQVIAFLNVLTWPESPSWLVSKNKFEECERSFFWLRGRSEESLKEFTALTQAQKKRAEFASEMTRVQTTLMFFKKFGRKDFVLPVLIILFGFMLHEACGKHVFPAYALDFVGKITGDHSQTFIYTLCMDLIITVSSTVSCVLIKSFPRRSVLYYGGISSMVTLLAVSLYLFLSSKGIAPNDKPWIPCSLIVLYLIVSNIGCTSIPMILLGEIFPLPHRGAGTGVAGLIMSLTLLLFLQMTPRLMAAINVYGTFTVFSLFISLTLLVLYFILPETKDRTLQEIEDYFNNGRFLDTKKDVEDDEARKKMLSEA